jgi:DNA-binding transcriptional ArsR family regulator
MFSHRPRSAAGRNRGQNEGVHRVPHERVGHRIIDADRVCDAVGALGEPGAVAEWAYRFDLLADPTRLALLVCIHRVGPISVSDLAVATGVNDTTVSQALRLLRGAKAVQAERDGRVVRYVLADPALAPLLDAVSPNAVLHHQPH